MPRNDDMPLKEAARIYDILTVALESEPRLRLFRPRSLLQGCSLLQFNNAVKLIQALSVHRGHGKQVKGVADSLTAMLMSLPNAFADDDEIRGIELLADEIRSLDLLAEDSREYRAEVLRVMDETVVEAQEEFPDIRGWERLSSFVDYCEEIEADPLYWQKIYTRLDLRYDADCPADGASPVVTFDQLTGKSTARIPTVSETLLSGKMCIDYINGFLAAVSLVAAPIFFHEDLGGFSVVALCAALFFFARGSDL